MYFLQIIVRVGLDGVYSVSTRTLVKTEYCFILYFHKDACGNGVLFLLISMEVRNDSNAKITSIPPFMKTEQITWKFVIPLASKWKMRLFSMSCYIHLYRTSDPRPNDDERNEPYNQEPRIGICRRPKTKLCLLRRRSLFPTLSPSMRLQKRTDNCFEMAPN